MSNKQKNKPAIPLFKTEAQERTYWESQDSTAHVDWAKAQQVKLSNVCRTAITNPTRTKTV